MSPARLGKKQDSNQVNIFITSIMSRIERWVLTHAFLCLIVAMCLLMALFVSLIFLLTGVSAVESGTVYNHMERII